MAGSLGLSTERGRDVALRDRHARAVEGPVVLPPNVAPLGPRSTACRMDLTTREVRTLVVNDGVLAQPSGLSEAAGRLSVADARLIVRYAFPTESLGNTPTAHELSGFSASGGRLITADGQWGTACDAANGQGDVGASPFQPGRCAIASQPLPERWKAYKRRR